MKIFNWFDVLVVVLLIVGIFHGRKRGMSLELLPLFKLLVIIVGGAKLYALFGAKLAEWTNGTISLMMAYICAYVLFALGIHMIFSRIKSAVGEKLVGGDIFGSMEYYFGMLAGMLRYGCYILIGLAVLNASPINQEKEKAYRKVEKDNLGNIQMPTITSVQINVFHESRTGTFSRSHLGELLIAPTSPDSKVAPNKRAIARKREQAVDEVISGANNPPPTAPKAQ